MKTVSKLKQTGTVKTNRTPTISLAGRTREAWQLIISHKKLTAAGVIVDFAFFFTFSWLATWTFMTMQEPLNKIYDIAGDNISKLAIDMNNPEGLSALLASQQEFMTAYTLVIQTALKFLGLTLILWLILQGISWAISHNIAGNRINGKEQATVYAWTRRFVVVTISGLIVIIGIIYFSIRTAAWANINRLGDLVGNAISTLVAVLFLATFYFVFCGYSSSPLAGSGATWRTAVKGWRKMLPAYLMMLVIVYASNILLSLLFEWSIWAAVAFGVLVVAPCYTYNRVVMVLSARVAQHIQ